MVSKEYIDKIYQSMQDLSLNEITEDELSRIFYHSKHCGDYGVHNDTVKLIAIIKVLEDKINKRVKHED